MSEKWNQKYVFILDDIFGDTQFDPRLGNYWTRKLITILNNSQCAAKFLIATRKNILEEFLKTNAELQIHGKLNDLNNCIFELGITNYTINDLKEILKTNAEFIKLGAPKMEILLKEAEMITQKRPLPGDIYNFLEEVKNSDNFDKNSLNRILTENNSGVNVFANRIKRLENSEKRFLYTLYITQDFTIGDLDAIYLKCLLLGSPDRHYLEECINKFEGKIIKIQIENEWFEKNRKLDFVHPIYKEAIEKLINIDKEERDILDDILNKLYNSINEQSITDWKSNSEKYDTLRFNIFQTILAYYADFSYHTKDHAIEILNDLSYKMDYVFENQELSVWNDVIKILDENVKFYPASRYIEKLFYNYDKFDDELKNKFNSLIIDHADILAYCFAYYLEPQTIIKFQEKLKELSNGSDKVKLRVAKCIIKNYDFINGENKKLLLSLGLKTTIMKYLMHNYDFISIELKEILFKQIQSATENELIESVEVFLVNYSFLPENIIKNYDFIFKSNNELIIKEVGKAFSTWFGGAFTFVNYDAQREKIDNKILNLYCEWLRSDRNEENTSYWCWHFCGDVGLQGNLAGSIYSYKKEKSDLINPKWIDPFYRKLKESIEIRLINLLSSKNTPTNKGYIYGDSFDWYQCSGNNKLLDKISNIINEEDSIKLEFLEECLWKTIDDIEIKEINNFPFKMTVSQFKLIEKLSKPPNRQEIQIKATKKLDYIKDLMDKKIIKITNDEYC